jgi:hypothetical protein
MDEPVVPGEEGLHGTASGENALDVDPGLQNPTSHVDHDFSDVGFAGTMEQGGVQKPKFSNVLPFHGNANTMNLNPLILNNIQSSHYFKGE